MPLISCSINNDPRDHTMFCDLSLFWRENKVVRQAGINYFTKAATESTVTSVSCCCFGSPYPLCSLVRILP